MKSSIDILFEQVQTVNLEIKKFNSKLYTLNEKKRKKCTIHPTDTSKQIRTKCKQAKVWGIYHEPLWNKYVVSSPNEPVDTNTDVDTTSTDGVGTVDELKGLAGSKFTFPMSSGPDDDYQLKAQTEADSSTERVRRYYRRHPEKVRKYLKDTVKDRVARNRDRRKAVKKYGKKKMKNHDVHHPNGAQNGNWKLAKKDHGRDKKNENYVYLEELLEGNVPYDNWILISEGGAAGHMAHPYEDNELTLADVKEMVRRGLVGELDAEEPVTEKLDGQNIMFTVRDGQVVFARNKGQVKNRGRTALDAAGISQMFAGRGGLQRAFGGAAEDLQRAIDALPQEQRDEMFSGGSKFMNVEIILPDTQNVIPYGKSVLVFHGTVEYDDEGNEVSRSTENGRTLADQITRVNAQQQQTFGISGPRTISFSDAQTVRNKRALKEIGAEITRLQEEYDLDDNSTIEDYKLAWWENKLIEISQQTGIDFTEEEFEGITRRWALGDTSFGVKDIEDSDKKKWFREFEAKELKQMQQQAVRPLESIFLRTGALALLRVTDLLSANNPEAAAKLKQEVLDAIREIGQTDDRNKLAALQTQIERLEDVGIDSIVPSEGMVFIYNGKPYKFTGAFAPVNQILGTLKFDKGKATVVEPDPDTERSTDEPPVQPPTPPDERRTVAIFTGRFQPFHAGHYSIYEEMVKRFGKENVFIATSDRTEAGRSPFGFRDKEEIMTRMFDIPEEMIVQVKNPYAPVEVLETLPPGTTYVTAVSQKDAERLSGGKYFQEYDPKTSTAGYAERGYFIVAPEMQLSIDGRNISGTQLRAIMGNPDIAEEVKQEIFTKVYGKFDQEIFDKIVKGATKAEEERKVTDTHGKSTIATKKSELEPKKPRDKKAAPEKSSSEFHKAGTTWPVGKKFAGKNSKGRIRYFNTEPAAKKFAAT